MRLDKINRLKELTEQLNRYRDSYYNNSESLISDKQYDDLFDELQVLEEETGIVMSNSPTKTVGYEVKSKLEKVKHSHPMLSLDKTKSTDDLIKFSDGRDCIISLKLDGLTVLNTYDNGVLRQSETRGNGEEGEIITHNAKVFDNLPLNIPFDRKFEIEGEAIITQYDFEKINTNGEYKNCRNLASGSVRQLDNNITKNRHVRFIAWKIPFGVTTYSKGFEIAAQYGFEVVPYVKYNSKYDDIEKAIKELKTIAKEKSLPIDGLVITYNNVEYGKSLGMTGHHPKHSLAYKFYDDIYPTKLLDVEFTMGKTGVLTPTAVFKPVEIDGSTVERASLHNLSIMKELGITHKGQIVNTFKANQVIPQIDSVEPIDSDDELDIIEIPTKCPICGGATEIVKDNESEVLMCTNPDCRGKLLGQLSHFVSKNAINIDGLSEQTLQKFIDLGWVKSFDGVYRLNEHKAEMYKLEGFGKKSVDKLLENIEKSRKTELSRFIYSLSIPLIGRTASKDIARVCHNDINVFIGMIKSNDLYKLTNSIDGFGDKMYISLCNYCKLHMSGIEYLANEFNFNNESKSENHIDLSGKTFVITGSLTQHKNRDELVNKIEQLGGKVSGSVSSKTSFLINNDTESNSSKNRKAKELGIPIISESNFLNMISE